VQESVCEVEGRELYAMAWRNRLRRDVAATIPILFPPCHHAIMRGLQRRTLGIPDFNRSICVGNLWCPFNEWN